MPTYEVVYKISAVRRKLYDASDEDEACERVADNLQAEMGVDESELDLLCIRVVMPREGREESEA